MKISKPVPQSGKRHSGRLIVDEYEQIKREREEQGVCPFCKNEIPLRLMSSHRNVCAFGASTNSIQFDQKQSNLNQRKMGFSTYSQKNPKKPYQIKQTPEKIESYRNVNKGNHSALSHKKIKNNKIFNLETGSVRNFSQNKNQKQSYRKTQNSRNKNTKNPKNFKIFDSSKFMNKEKLQKKQQINRSMASEQYKQYYGQCKKKGASKIKKNIKNAWIQQQNRKNNKHKANINRIQIQKQQRQQKLRRLQNETQKLKKQQQQLIRQLQKEKKKQKKEKVRNNSQLRNEQRPQNRPRQQSQRRNQIPSTRNQNMRGQGAQRQNESRQNRRNPTLQESYYEEIPVNHPHRTLNFISQTINEQFQMMKQQFEHMNQFFSNFVPFSNNGFVYFQRAEDSDYSIDSSDQQAGYEQEAEETGLYDEQIEMLPRHVYQKRIKVDDQCAVCISSINHQQMVRRLPCQHIFHCECIDEWLRRKAMCPVCRDQIADL